jgi:hypothetical protein
MLQPIFFRYYADFLLIFCRHLADFGQVAWRQYTDSQMAFCRYLADIFSGIFADSLHAFCRLFTEFLKAFCRLFANNLHAVQTFHRLIVIRTLQWINGLISVFFDGGSSLFFAQKFLQQLLLGKACYCC